MAEVAEETRLEVSDESNIMNYYGLKSNPLDLEEPFYFYTPHLTKSLKLFNYLTSFSNKIIVMTAPVGTGKAAFAEEFEKNQSDKKIVCKIKALRFDTPSQLLHELAEQLELNVKDNIGQVNLIKALKVYAQKVADEERVVIVIIEEAHVLADLVIEALFQLVTNEPDGRGGIKLILSAEPCVDNIDFVEAVEQLSAKASGNRDLFFYSLHPFTLEECKHYLQACFDRQGDLDKIPFSEEDYSHIHQASDGLPQKINLEAIRVMEQGLNRLIVEKKEGPRWMLASAVAICIGVGVLVTAYLWDSKPKARVSVPAVQDNQEPKPGRVTGTIERESVVTFTSADSVNETANLQPVSGEVSSITSSQPIESNSKSAMPELQVESVDPQDRVTIDLDLNVTLPENEPQKIIDDSVNTASSTQDEVVAILVPPVIEPAPDLKEEVKSGLSGYTDHERAIMSFRASDYTMQMLGSRTLESATRFMESFPSVKQFRYFETVNKGEPWFVVIFGRYQTRAQALAAVEQLPAGLQKQKPWVRRVSGIQKSIKVRDGSG
jgi:DamX protein